MTSWKKNLLTRLFRRNDVRRASKSNLTNRFRPSFLALEDRTVPSGSNLFADATILSGTTVTATGSNVGADSQPGEIGILGGTPNKTVWWQWTAPVNGTVEVNTVGSSFDTLLGVYTGSSIDSLMPAGATSEDDDGIAPQSQAFFDAQAGTTYFIVVDGFAGSVFGDEGDIVLHVGMAPSNDNFASAIGVSGGTVTGSNVASTGQLGEPLHSDDEGPINSAWWKWTATTSGSTEFNTIGSDFDTVLAVYTGSSVDQLTPVVANDDIDRDGGNLQSQVIFNAVGGMTYYIAVDGFLNATGAISLTLPDAPTSQNTAPVINNQSFSVNENSTAGTVVGTVVASDPDAGQSLHYTITGGNTGGTFSINFTTGLIQVLDSMALNYEANPTFNLTVLATDTGDPQLSASATVTIHLNNVNEVAVFSPAGPFSLTENSANGTTVGTVTATDPDAGQSLTYSIVGGNTGGAFAINASTGKITVANAAAVDYETNPSFTLTVRVVDNGSPSLAATTSVSVSLLNVDDTSPAFLFNQLSGMVQNLQSSGDLTASQAASLQAQLDAAKKQYDKANINPTVNQLKMFISQVNNYVNTGVLTSAEGQPLIAAANNLIASVQNPTASAASKKQ